MSRTPPALLYFPIDTNRFGTGFFDSTSRPASSFARGRGRRRRRRRRKPARVTCARARATPRVYLSGCARVCSKEFYGEREAGRMLLSLMSSRLEGSPSVARCVQWLVLDPRWSLVVESRAICVDRWISRSQASVSRLPSASGRQQPSEWSKAKFLSFLSLFFESFREEMLRAACLLHDR